MNQIEKTLLRIDGWINVILGILILAFPLGILSWLGLPSTDTYFYTSLLGAVILGIGIALFLELKSTEGKISGLGIAGAIAINLVGSGVLIIWLIINPFDLPLRGYIVLWTVALLVLGTGVAELILRNRTGSVSHG